MPRKQLLSSAERDSLLALPDDELAMTRIAFLSEQDMALIHHHRRPANRLGFAVLLCYLRYPGFIPDDKSPPDQMLLTLIARQLKLSEELWAEYATRAETRWEHLSELYRYLNLTPFGVKIQQECVKELTMLATRTDKGILLAEALVTHLRRNDIIIPSIDVLERTCAEAVVLGDKAVFAALNKVQIGLNKGEARNALARAVFLNRLGEIRDRSFERQRYRASGLNLVTAAIILWNTVYLERTLDALRRKGYPIDESLFPHFSPLGWEHINLTGDYIWRNNQKLGNGKFRPLRPLDIR